MEERLFVIMLYKAKLKLSLPRAAICLFFFSFATSLFPQVDSIVNKTVLSMPVWLMAPSYGASRYYGKGCPRLSSNAADILSTQDTDVLDINGKWPVFI